MSKKTDLAAGMKRGLEGRAENLRDLYDGTPATPVAVPLSDDTYEIQLTAIQPDPNQPRKVFAEQQLEELAASIRERGVLEPISVYEGEPGSYVIITGERRWRASKLADKPSIPCIVRGSGYDRSQIDVDQLIENVQRADLEPVEAARALSDLMKKHELSQVATAKRLGKPRTWVVELASILKIDDALLERAQHLPKRVLVEVARAPQPEHEPLIDQALSVENPVETVREQRSNRKPRTPSTHYRERFDIDGKKPIKIEWGEEEPSDAEVAEALGKVIAQLRNRSVG